MCLDCGVKGLWHTEEAQAFDDFINSFSKAKKKPAYSGRRPAPAPVPAPEAQPQQPIAGTPSQERAAQ